MLRLKLQEALSAPVPQTTARSIRLPKLANKALAVVGVRRGGKTSFLYQNMAQRYAAGAAQGTQILISLEDERLVGMTSEDLGWLLDQHKSQVPALRAGDRRTVYLDEVQVVPGWETVVRRLLDAHDADVFVSGSSAKLLSREVHTSLRGRAMEVLVHPFSFREALRHADLEPSGHWQELNTSERATLESALNSYLKVGGFPEAQGSEDIHRIPLLKGYVDLMVFRDVVERHAVSNIEALRCLQRHLLASPAAPFSVSKFYRDLRSQKVAVGEETLYTLLGHLEDAFLIRQVFMHTESERQRQRNPRKMYPIDTGLFPIYERAGRENRGAALETAVMLELERRGYTVGWVRAGTDLEVDFHAESHVFSPLLIQVSLETSADATWDREVRALQAAAAEHPEARTLLLTLDPTPPPRVLPGRLEWQSVAQWLLTPP